MTTLFAQPGRLWILAALIPWAILIARGSRRRDRDWARLGQPGRPAADGSRPWLVAAGFLILALAGPRWGRVIGRDSPPGHDLVVLVDASRSMAAEDAVPDRMGVAIESAVGLLAALKADPGNRAAVVAFAGRGVVRCPLTGDLDAAIDAIQSIAPGDVQPGGTDLGAGLEAALEAFDEEEHAEGRAIVVLSDGEDHAGRWDFALDRLKAEGVVVHSVAIGDPESAHEVPDRSAAAAQGKAAPGPMSRRSDVAFAMLAKGTGGAFLPIGLSSADLGPLYRDRIAPTARRNHRALRLPDRIERFPIFVLSALTVGLAGSWPGRTRRRPHARGWRGRRPGLAAAIVAAMLGAGQGGSPAGDLIDQGRAAYGSGRYPEALAAFDRARAMAPRAAIPPYDAAATLFQLHRYPEAIARYEESRKLSGPDLRVKIDYALGNSYLAVGDFPAALAAYDLCLASTVGGADADAVRGDAALNRAYAAERIKPPPIPPEAEGSGGGDPARDRPPAGKGRPDPSRSRTAGSPSGDGKSRSDGSGPPASGGSRGAGGGGGQGEANPEPGSPGSKLDEALRDVGESRRRRPPDGPPRGLATAGKDW